MMTQRAVRWRWPTPSVWLVIAGLLAMSCARPAPTDTGPSPVDLEAPDSVPAVDSLVIGDTLPTAELPAVLDVPVPEAEPPETIAVAVRELRVCAGGDVMLGNNLDTLWAVRASNRLGWAVQAFPDPDELLAPLRPLVEDAQVVLLNIEGAIGEGPAPTKCRLGSQTCYAFRQQPGIAEALRRLVPGEVVGSVANNHALDAGRVGWDATVRHLGLAGVYVTGYDTLPTVVETAAGDTVAFLGFSSAQAGPDPRDLAGVRRHVTRAAARYPRLIVTMHMGAEGRDAQRTPNEAEHYLGENRGNAVAFARAAVESGASAVFGHGPHVMRAAEWYQGALIFYSLGNLLTYGPFSLVEPLNRGGMACVVLDPAGRVKDAVLRSTWQRPPGLITPDRSQRAAWLVDSLSALDFPTTAPRFFGEVVLRSPGR